MNVGNPCGEDVNIARTKPQSHKDIIVIIAFYALVIRRGKVF